ncbi:redox-regulated ATPase YchF [Candidatus Woesearchaeota archaeon]|nr:redox-regulated ATPase YchF [Candidatus Woesearchaeota archaeon]
MIVGIVGKANVGKSTFFKSMTLASIEIANYPFVTIKPNHGIGFVRIPCVDKFFNTQCNPRVGYCVDHNRFVPIDLIDVAGLVPGAHEGKGMGNQFLNDLNQADALIHVIDVSGGTNEKGEPVRPLSYDPANDIKFLEVELDHWYFGILNKGWERLARQIQQEHSIVQRVLAKQLGGLGVDEEMMKAALKELNLADKIVIQWTEDDLFKLASYLRKRTKPMIIAANKMDVPGAKDNYLRLRADFPHLSIIPCSAESELALKEANKHGLIKYIPGDTDFKITPEGEAKLSDKQKQALNFIKANVLEKYVEGTGVQSVLNATVFGLLKLITIFPGGVNKLADKDGNVLPDCFLLKQGSTALDFAYKIHTDLGDNFVKAIDVKTKRALGKEHVLNNGDVIEIITSK